VSIHTAKREPHRAAIRARHWDMVIVDEAHHLRNRNTQVWRLASELQKRYILLLTATPVQNNLEELFNLVTLLEPGLLSTARQFQKRFVDRKDKLTPRNVDQLHDLLSEVMVRNRRSTVGLHFTRRWARTECLPLGGQERELYEDVTRLVRRHLRGPRQGGLNRMAMLSLQMALGSSSQAAAGTVARLAAQPKLAEDEREELTRLAGRARTQAGSSKADRLLELLPELADKTVIFTQFRATQQMLSARLREAGHEVALFHGGLSRMQKEEAIERFRGPAGILLATESGSEGRNLQFAHAVCNFDLPWNPMKIEQRIGRLSRIGQTRDVHVLNLVAAGTVEAAVLHLLEAKLSMFELVIGEIDMILGNLDDQREFDEMVADLWLESDDTDDFSRRMEDLGNRLIAAKDAYFQQRSHDDRLFGNRFAPEG
jgi:SNF2 family DNA or RNA helicase